MAIRNDFAPGEVLAAADLNDTFGSKVDYPSGGADGDALIKDGTAAVWGAAGGLTLITSESFSAVSSVSLNGVFTSAYENYRMVITATTSSAVGVSFRYRVSGTDATGSNYIRQSWNASGSVLGAATSTLAFGIIIGTGTAGLHWGNVEYFRPFAAEQTLSLTMGNNVAPSSEIHSTQHTLSTSYDGITIYPDSGTFTGTLRVYGYQNS
jgi:hypothetical protein